MTLRATQLVPGANIDKYRIEKQIGRGGCGAVYLVVDSLTGERYAMKTEYKDRSRHVLENEIRVLSNISQCPMFPKLIDHGERPEFFWMVIELLGPSLSACRQQMKGVADSQFSVSKVSIEMLRCIEQLHKDGYVHCDIKPANFLVRSNRACPICLIDFGLARKFVNDEKHISFRENVGFTGTSRYASVNSHEHVSLSRRDDLMSWFYSVVELATGILPWSRFKESWKIEEMKKDIPSAVLCRKLPQEFMQIYKYISRLGFDEDPNYVKIKRLIRKSSQETWSVGNLAIWTNFGSDDLQKISEISLDNLEQVCDADAPNSLDLSYSSGGCGKCCVA